MRNFFSSFCRLIASFLLMAVLTSGIAMAAYVCPELANPAPEMMEGMPCAEMDLEKPVQCAKAQAGEDLALEQLASVLSLTPSAVTFVMPAPSPVVPAVVVAFHFESRPDPGRDPPYLRTLRLRI